MVGYNHVLNKRFVQKQMNSLANTCTIVVITRSFSDDAYRQITSTKTNHTGIKCLVSIMSEADESVKQGEARSGDLFFYFDHAQESYCNQMNQILFDNKTFQIYDVHKFDAIGNTTYMIECRTRKVLDGTENTETLSEDLEIDDSVAEVKA